MVSYLCNTSWPDFPKLVKVLVAIVLNRVFSLQIPSRHITLFTVSCFLSQILRIHDNGRNRNLRDLLLFFLKKLTEKPPQNCKIHWENLVEVIVSWLGQLRNYLGDFRMKESCQSKPDTGFDVIYTDIVGLKQFKRIIGSKLIHYKYSGLYLDNKNGNC